MQIRKREGPNEKRYEEMQDAEFFSLFRQEYSYTGDGLNMEKSLKEKSPEELGKEWMDYATHIYRVSEEKANRLNRYMTAYVYGFHVLSPLIEDPDITDIRVLNWRNIWVKRKGKHERGGVRFESPEDLKTFTEMLAVRNGVNLGNSNAMRSVVDKTSCKDKILRITINTGRINDSGEPALHIRIASTVKKTMEDLIREGMLSKESAAFLKERLTQGYLLVDGPNASGKTTLMNALLEEYPEEASVLVAQENEELFSIRKDNKLFQHVEVQNGDPKSHYGLKELVINALMMDTEYIVIGEIKGAEALYFITAGLTGCKGMASIHSESAEGALEKMCDYCKWESDYSRYELFKLLSYVKTIVHIEDFQVREIVVNHGFDEKSGGNRLEAVFDSQKGVNRL